MRVFIAVDIEGGIKEKIEYIKSELEKTGADIKFVEKENLHLTLKFLGEVGGNRIDEVVNKISSCVNGVKQFKIGIESVGFFGSPNNIRTVWVGVKEGREQLINVIEKLNRNLGYIRKEAHGPSLHLTIGRLRTGVNKEQLTQKISELNGVKIGETVVKEIVLKQSQLTKTGPIYTDLKAFCLEQSQQDSA